MSDGMFLSACREVSKDFPDIKYDEDLLDRVCLQVRKCATLLCSPTLNQLPDCYQPEAFLRPCHGDAQSVR